MKQLTAVFGHDLSLVLKYLRLVDGDEHTNTAKAKSESMDRPTRMNPLLAKTLFVQYW